jgi:hypothetical protein
VIVYHGKPGGRNTSDSELASLARRGLDPLHLEIACRLRDIPTRLPLIPIPVGLHK